MKWFRMYNDARTDAKLESLSDSEFRVWFRLMCFANEQSERGVVNAESDLLLAVEVAKGDVELLKQTVNKLEALRVLRSSDSRLEFINWEKRQFDSDGSTERWRKWKNQQQTNVGQTLELRSANGEPTRLDPDKEKELKDLPRQGASVSVQITEHGGAQSNTTGKGNAPAEKPGYSVEFERFWTTYPRKKDKGPAYKCWLRVIKKREPEQIILAAENYSAECSRLRTEEQYIKHASTFLGPAEPYVEYIREPDELEPDSGVDYEFLDKWGLG